MSPASLAFILIAAAAAAGCSKADRSTREIQLAPAEAQEARPEAGADRVDISTKEAR